MPGYRIDTTGAPACLDRANRIRAAELRDEVSCRRPIAELDHDLAGRVRHAETLGSLRE
ncbi:hypothetical protein [Streptomyces palmae]|uniref:hypothetical protein n=1 Tax=Streptomyces palmae TaxID=1701085 RepID=UPI00143320C9|nr:hypothetical protein [Streptomyces palmae]